MKFPKRLITQTPECLTEPISQVINVIISTLFALVFLTAYADYSLVAWKTEACGFILKPMTPDGLKEQLKKLRFPLSMREVADSE